MKKNKKKFIILIIIIAVFVVIATISVAIILINLNSKKNQVKDKTLKEQSATSLINYSVDIKKQDPNKQINIDEKINNI